MGQIRQLAPYFVPSREELTTLLKAAVKGFNIAWLLPVRGIRRDPQLVRKKFIENKVEIPLKKAVIDGGAGAVNKEAKTALRLRDAPLGIPQQHRLELG